MCVGLIDVREALARTRFLGWSYEVNTFDRVEMHALMPWLKVDSDLGFLRDRADCDPPCFLTVVISPTHTDKATT